MVWLDTTESNMRATNVCIWEAEDLDKRHFIFSKIQDNFY